MRQLITGLSFLVSQSLMAAGVPVYVDKAVITQVQSGTAASGRVVAGEIYTLSAEISESIRSMTVRVGDRVKAGDELARLDDTEIRNNLKSLNNRMRYLKAQLTLLNQRKAVREKQLRRAQSLTTKDLLTRDATEEVELNVINAESDVGKTLYELEDLKIEIAGVARQLNHTRVKVGTSGRIIEVNVTEGQYVRSGDRLFQLLPDLGVEVEAEVRPEAYESVSVGQIITGKIRQSFYDLKVRALIAEQNQRTGSRTIRLQFVSPPKESLVLGEPIDLRLPIGQMSEQITIAKDAVIPSKDGHRIVLIIAGKAEPRRITLGAGVGNRIAVTKGLKAGDLVVTQGQEGLRKGQKVSILGDQS